MTPCRSLTARCAKGLAAMAAVLVALTPAPPITLQAQERASFPTQDGGLVHADVYGKGDNGIVLAHGARFNKESWAPQARELAAAGFRVLAIDFRGYGQSKGPGQSDPLSAPLHFDVLGAVRYLQSTGSKTVSLIGAPLAAMPRRRLDPTRSVGSCCLVPTPAAHPGRSARARCSS
jgi:hypothetical protein